MKITLIGLLCLLMACSSKPLTLSDLEAFVASESNGVSRTIETDNGLTVRVSYRPTDLWVAQELGGLKATSNKVAGSRAKYREYLYFILSVSRQGNEVLEQIEGDRYSELLETLSFRMDRYVTLLTEKDNIAVSNFVLNRTYGTSTSTDILLVFDRSKISDSSWVKFYLKEFGLGTGDLLFHFDRSKIDGVPEIHFDI